VKYTFLPIRLSISGFFNVHHIHLKEWQAIWAKLWFIKNIPRLKVFSKIVEFPAILSGI
jgi:hypothetical protein